MGAKSHEKGARAHWGSNLGFLLAAAGSAVGLGNIWKFPGKAHAGGGGAFILTYIIIVALIGTSVMLAELTIGRKTQLNPVGAFRKLNKRFSWIGGLGVIIGFIILSYYSQVGGWVMKYIVGYIVEPGAVMAAPKDYFMGFLGSNAFPLESAVIYPLIFLAAVVAVVILGVKNGIERLNKFAMPALFILLIILLVRAVTLPGADEGVSYLLTLDFSNFSGETVLSALGQAFYSLSLGMGIMCTYGSYLKKDENLGKNVGIICTMDTLVALIAGFIVIPAVFAAGVDPGMGAAFAFVSLAEVFKQMPAGAIFGVMFYLLLFFAALTSAISILEGTVSYLTEERKLSRPKATIGVSCAMFVVGIFYTLSQVYMADTLRGVWFDGVNGLTFPILGDFMEFLTDRLMIPVTALMICIFAGWIWGTKNAALEIRQDGKFKFPLEKAWSVLIKFVAPLGIFAILVGGLVFGLTLS